MFYVGNVHQWLNEVIEACNENSLNPADSVFVLVFFSSLDFEYVEFFRDRKNQISSFSGENVHIFSPIIFDDVVPDGEWRMLREEFAKDGIALGAEPTALFFELQDGTLGARGRRSRKHYMPDFFSANKLPQGQPLTRTLRDVVEVCIRHRRSRSRLAGELSKVTRAPNLVRVPVRTSLVKEIESALDQPRVFLSHSSEDKALVRHFCAKLQTYGFRPWLDELELKPGDQLSHSIEQALEKSDLLLVFLSAASSKSVWLQHELAYFAGAAKDSRIVPVVLDDAGKALAAKLPATDGRLYVDATDSKNLEKALESIRKLARG
ncbi:MAG: toll/interleukin-1 receptor domain-containing protein [Hyphomicrobium sp.]